MKNVLKLQNIKIQNIKIHNRKVMGKKIKNSNILKKYTESLIINKINIKN